MRVCERQTARACVCICAGTRAAVNQRFILRASIACMGVEAGGQESARIYLLLPLPGSSFKLYSKKKLKNSWYIAWRSQKHPTQHGVCVSMSLCTDMSTSMFFIRREQSLVGPLMPTPSLKSKWCSLVFQCNYPFVVNAFMQLWQQVESRASFSRDTP